MSEQRPTLHFTMLSSFLAAFIGAGLGWLYAKLSLPADVYETQGYMRGIYGSAGAVLGVVALRFGLLAKEMLTDYFDRRR